MRWEELGLTENELNKRNMLDCETEDSCGVCGSLTRYTDYCFEARICSKECQETLNDDYFSYVRSVRRRSFGHQGMDFKNRK